MSTIEELRRRVEAAERRFGLIDEQERRYSERLIGLMDALEAAQNEKQAEAAAHQARLAELERENGELRGMLHALLLGVEAGGRDTLAETLHALDARLSSLLNAAPAESAPSREGATAEAVSGKTPAEAPDDAAALLVEKEPAAQDLVADADLPAGEIELEAVEPTGPDAVAAAEQAVAALIGADAEAEDGATLDGGEGAAVGSPVAELIERLEEESQFFPELAVVDDGAPAPTPEPARKQA